MRITLKGNPPDDLVTLLNAVREAYLQEAANRELNDKTASLRWYRQMIEDDEGKLATLQAEVAKKAQAMNAADAVSSALSLPKRCDYRGSNAGLMPSNTTCRRRISSKLTMTW